MSNKILSLVTAAAVAGVIGVQSLPAMAGDVWSPAEKESWRAYSVCAVHAVTHGMKFGPCEQGDLLASCDTNHRADICTKLNRRPYSGGRQTNVSDRQRTQGDGH